MVTHRITPTRRTAPRRGPGGRIKDTPNLARVRVGEVEQTLRRAAHRATTLMRGTRDDAAVAAGVVRRSMRDAMRALTLAGRRIARRFGTATRSAQPPAARASRPVPARANRAQRAAA